MLKNKTKLKDYLTYSWYIVLLVAVLSYTLSYYLVSYVNEYKREEVFSMFVTSYGIKDNSLEDRIYDKYFGDGINKVNIYNFSYEDEDISSYYANFGEKSDLVILYESDLEEMGEYIENKFVQLNEYMDEYSTYSYEDKAYGILINDNKNSGSSFLSSCFEFDGKIDKPSYLLINKTSPHFTSKDSIGYNILNDLLKGEI